MLPGAEVVGEEDGAAAAKKEVMLASARGFLAVEVSSTAFRFRDIVLFDGLFLPAWPWIAARFDLRAIGK